MDPRGLTRRVLVKRAGAIGVLAIVPPATLDSLLASAPAVGERGRFLSALQLDTLRAVTDRLLPGPPDDPSPGALQAGVAEAIDLLLGAFNVSPPLIHAGGPFSNRAGSRRDDFAHFVPLDRQAELGWRIRLEGSRGMPEREFAGPVIGWQQIYTEGLAHIDQRSLSEHGVAFAQASSAEQDVLLGDTADKALEPFMSVALANTLEAMYGAPEYGGNRGLIGWSSNGWRGDSQPDGYSHKQVTEPDARPAHPSTDELRFEGRLPDLRGRGAPRDAPWLGRPGLGRG
jgi:hypothetical protein